MQRLIRLRVLFAALWMVGAAACGEDPTPHTEKVDSALVVCGGNAGEQCAQFCSSSSTSWDVYRCRYCMCRASHLVCANANDCMVHAQSAIGELDVVRMLK